MNHEQALRQELRNVGDRYRRLLFRVSLAACWLVLAAAGLVVLMLARGAGYAVPGVALVLLVAIPLVLLPILARALRTVRNPLWVARRVERRFPDLDARLLAALDQRAENPQARLGFLQHAVIREALDHAGGGRWEQLVPASRLAAAKLAQWATLVAFLAVLVQVVVDIQHRPGSGGWLAGGATGQRDPGDFEVKVEPEDTEVERGTGLLVLARFGGLEQLPGDVQLLYRTPDGQERQLPMSKSLDDPVFAGRVASVDRDLTYAVRYGSDGRQTRWYSATVFDHPDLERADARLKFPEYTGLEERLIEDTRSVTAVEGTQATFSFRLNKPVADAKLLPHDAAAKDKSRTASSGAASPGAVTLAADAEDPNVYTVALDLKQSKRFRLQLVDAQGRRNKEQPELVVNVTQNRPPELKLQWPGRDVDVSPLEELSIRAQAWDDFGLRRVGVSYGLAGQDETDVVLGENAKAKETRHVTQLVPLENLAAEPDALLSYYVWAEDVGPDGKVRRTSSDMFFAEVRGFEQVFRQGQAPAGGEQQQQEGGPNGEQAEQLAQLQKQIIAATWKVIRRETTVANAPTAELAPDATLVGQSQTGAHAQAEALGEQLQDERSKAHLKNVLKHMDAAAEQLAEAAGGPAVEPLTPAVKSERAAYQELLKLRAREIEVVRGRQQQGQQSSSSANSRRQQQLEQLELDQEENRYEQRSAAAQQPETAEQRETRQVLNRLRELAQRQEDLNRKMQELQSALQQAEDEAKREELKRQLARLRDQQEQMLRDTDELRDRMDQPENQQRMAESREQLEQTRENVRRASEALADEMVAEARAQGARAGEQLNELRDEFRKAAAGQFDEAMDRMRQDARALDAEQQELSKQLDELDPQKADGQKGRQQPSLREGDERQKVARGLQEQKQQLEKLLEDMRRTIEESEASEPLLSKKLYDAVRETRQEKTDQVLDASGQLLDQGFLDEAKVAETEATRGISKLREGVERAAESVLGDEAEALRRARDELDALAQELEREIGQRDPNAAAEARQPTTEPSGGGDARRLAQGGATTRESVARAGGEREPGERQQQDGGAEGQGEPAQEQGFREGQAGGERPSQGEGERAQRRGAGAEQGEREPGGNREGEPGEARESGEDGDVRQFLPGWGRESLGGGGGGEDRMAGGPITGEGFRDWSDRLRDVEESVTDPRLRAEAARIRDRAREVRSEFKRHSEEPNWELVREFVSEPLVELRDRVSQELMRRESKTALVPIDREPVAPEYVEQVRRYYERLGSAGGGDRADDGGSE